MFAPSPWRPFSTAGWARGVTAIGGSGDAGVLFRTTEPAIGTDRHKGYYADEQITL